MQIRKTWIDIDTLKERGGYFYFYETVKFSKFKFYKDKSKATNFDTLEKAKSKIKFFKLKGIKIIK